VGDQNFADGGGVGRAVLAEPGGVSFLAGAADDVGILTAKHAKINAAKEALRSTTEIFVELEIPTEVERDFMHEVEDVRTQGIAFRLFDFLHEAKLDERTKQAKNR
jgi:hypothetical protein